MDTLKRIEQIERQIEQLEAKLAHARQRYEKTQDPVLRNAIQEEIGELIDAIDQDRSQLAKEQAKLPEKRSNGHHPPENEGDLELPIDLDVNSQGDEPSDN
jgi:septation ring formation regulator EzrA